MRGTALCMCSDGVIIIYKLGMCTYCCICVKSGLGNIVSWIQVSGLLVWWAIITKKAMIPTYSDQGLNTGTCFISAL